MNRRHDRGRGRNTNAQVRRQRRALGFPEATSCACRGCTCGRSVPIPRRLLGRTVLAVCSACTQGQHRRAMHVLNPRSSTLPSNWRTREAAQDAWAPPDQRPLAAVARGLSHRLRIAGR